MKKLILSAAIATVSLAAVAKDDLQYSKATEQALKSGKIAYFIESKKGAGEKKQRRLRRRPVLQRPLPRRV